MIANCVTLHHCLLTKLWLYQNKFAYAIPLTTQHWPSLAAWVGFTLPQLAQIDLSCVDVPLNTKKQTKQHIMHAAPTVVLMLHLLTTLFFQLVQSSSVEHIFWHLICLFRWNHENISNKIQWIVNLYTKQVKPNKLNIWHSSIWDNYYQRW